MGRDGQCGSCGKKALLRQIFIVGYLKFVDSRRMPAALFSTGYGDKEILQEAVHEWY